MNKKFWHYLKTNLTAHEYEHLAELLGCSETRLSRLKSGNSDFLLEELKNLSVLLNISVLELINVHKVGRSTLLLSDMDALAAMDGLEVTTIPHVA